MNLKNSRKQKLQSHSPALRELSLLSSACPLHSPLELLCVPVSDIWPHGFSTMTPSYIITFQMDGQFDAF